MINLPKVVTRRAKRKGRGRGSGKGGHTTGRGQKGQKSRGKIGILFEGVKVRKSLLRRLPLKRGKDKFKPINKKPIVIDVSLLDLMPEGSKVNVQSLAKFGIVNLDDATRFGVKILGKSKLKKKFEIEIPMSHSAKKANDL